MQWRKGIDILKIILMVNTLIVPIIGKRCPGMVSTDLPSKHGHTNHQPDGQTSYKTLNLFFETSLSWQLLFTCTTVGANLRYSPSPWCLMRGDLGGIYDVLLSWRSVLINSRAVLLCRRSTAITRLWGLLGNEWKRQKFILCWKQIISQPNTCSNVV